MQRPVVKRRRLSSHLSPISPSQQESKAGRTEAGVREERGSAAALKAPLFGFERAEKEFFSFSLALTCCRFTHGTGYIKNLYLTFI